MERTNSFQREVKSTETNNVNGKRVWQSRALVSPTGTLITDLAPNGDDTEPIEVPRADVGMGNDEDEEPLEAEIPKVRMHPKNPTSREKQEHEDAGQCCVQESVCGACVEGRGVGGHHRIDLLEGEEREGTTPIVAFDYGFLTEQTRFHL